MKDTKYVSGGIGFWGLLQIVFIVLKLVAIEPIASWSWGLVLLPLWIELGTFVLVFVIALIFIGVKSKYF